MVGSGQHDERVVRIGGEIGAAMGKRGDKRRARQRTRRRLRRLPYEGFQAGPLRVERLGRHIRTSLDPSFEGLDEFRQAQIEAAGSLPGHFAELREELKTSLAHYDAFDVLANLWLLNVPKDPETYREWDEEGVLAVVEIVASMMIEREHRAGEAPQALLTGETITQAQDLAKTLLTVKALSAMVSTSEPGTAPTPLEDIRARALAHRIGVRGPAYDWQERATFMDLCDDPSIKPDVLTACGLAAVTATALVDAVDEIGLQKLQDKVLEARETADKIIADVERAAKGLDVQDPRSKGIAQNLQHLPADEVAGRIHNAAIAWVGAGLGSALSFTSTDLAARADCDPSDAESFLRMFSVGFGDFSALGRPVDIEDFRDRPLIKDADDRYLCVSPHNLHWGLRPRFEQNLKEAGQASFKRYERHRSRTIESRAVAALTNALRADWSHEGLEYQVSENGAVKRPELDGLVALDSALVIIEAKASSMRASARRVAPLSFKEWLEDEVSAAAQQARRAKQAILDEGAPVFDSDRRPLQLDLRDVHHVFEVVVVLEDLPAVGPSTWLLADAGILPKGPIPWVVSLHELEVICDVIARPAELVHYLQRRQRMDETRRAWAMDELDYFMHYLLFGLFWPAPADGTQDTSPPEQLLSHTENLDAWYMYQRGQRKTPAERPHANHHAKVAALLDCLDNQSAPGRLDAALAVLDVSAKERRKLVDLIEQLKRRSQLDGKWHDASRIFKDFGISIMSCAPAQSTELADRLAMYCTMKKYQQKAESWVGFGCWAGPSDAIQCAFVLWGLWSPDAELERLVAGLPTAGATGNFDGRSEARRLARRARKSA
jgi:hypothetical protein